MSYAKYTIEDLYLRKFNRLTVIGYVGMDKYKRKVWLCKCDCGKEIKTSITKLKNGYVKSCGCLNKEVVAKLNLDHGMCKSRLHNIWGGLKGRALNENNKQFGKYGGRGIDVCDEWRNSFNSFREWAYKNGYSDDLSIDRIDNNKGYYPDNCRWATDVIQMNNRNNNKFFEYKGECDTLANICRKYNKNYSLVAQRLRYGKSIEYAMEKEVQIHNRDKLQNNI